ncbi:MAG: IS3 family transposase [Eubacteriales bacterium]|nr:IS3 family transposase [Eubacteriales bacterium]
MLKTECIHRSTPKTFAVARELIDEYIDFYNHERIQTKTHLTPFEKRSQAA